MAMLKRLCKDEPEVLKMLREATTGKQGERTDLVDNVNEVKDVKKSAGNAKDYTLDRLARNHPTLYTAVVEGDMSANAAAIDAGFRTKTASIPVRKGGEILYERAAKALMKRFDMDVLHEHAQRLREA